MSPGPLQASASFTICSLYSTVYVRRLAFSGTSVTSSRDDIAVAVMVGSWLALLSKLHGSSCLTHVGREGIAGRCEPGAQGARYRCLSETVPRLKDDLRRFRRAVGVHDDADDDGLLVNLFGVSLTRPCARPILIFE